MDKAALIALAKATAAKYGLDPELVCAVCEQESDWNPWAMRFEPAFYEHYILPIKDAQHLTNTEANARATSWGLMQLLGEVAREYAFSGVFLSELCDPGNGLEMGCKYLSALMGKVGNDVDAALLRWNGGGSTAYPDEVKARIPTYA
jgi:soluble lytic murein transglycosylase-like protein